MSKTPFVDALVQESLPIWQQCLDSDFLRGLEAGTLDEDCFKGYIVDDSLYLREYARVFAWGMTKAQTMAAMRNYYSLLSFVNENEDVARLQYLKRYGLTDDGIQSLPQRPANRAYTDYMIGATKNGEGEAECIAAVLPCMLSYFWIFRRLLKRSPGVLDTVFGPLVKDYASDGYGDACQAWADYAEKACAGLSPERAARCREIFKACSEFELGFWRMANQPRSDL